MDEGKLRSFLRKVMAQGADMRWDYDRGAHTGYEQYSARLDAAAADRARELAAMIDADQAAMRAEIERLRLELGELRESLKRAPSLDAAAKMGADGANATEDERLAFEAWMRGHCWAVVAQWDGSQYIGSAEKSGSVDPHAVMMRRMWAAWRDRAALACEDMGAMEASLVKANDLREDAERWRKVRGKFRPISKSGDGTAHWVLDGPSLPHRAATVDEAVDAIK